jgi:hypothetical protein
MLMVVVTQGVDSAGQYHKDPVRDSSSKEASSGCTTETLVEVDIKLAC